MRLFRQIPTVLIIGLAGCTLMNPAMAEQIRKTEAAQISQPQEATPATPPEATAPQAGEDDTNTQVEELSADVKSLKETVKKGEEAQKLLEAQGAVRSSGASETICSMTTESCVPDRIFINGDTKSNVKIIGIPPGTCKLIASANETFSDTLLDSDSYETEGSAPKIVLLNLHLRKLLYTTYGAWNNGKKDKNAKKRLLRDPKAPGRGLNLLVHSSVRSVKIEAYPCIAQPRSEASQPKTVIVDIDYGRWEIEGGGFYAFSSLSDEELVKQSEPGAGTVQQVKIISRRDGGYRGDTGVSFNFYPGNYPWVGFAFGIANAGQAPSYFLGFGPRLLSFGRRAVIAATLGVAAVKTKTFPGISEGDVLPADSPLLDGRSAYHLKPYLSIHIGFSVGVQAKGGDSSVQ